MKERTKKCLFHFRMQEGIFFYGIFHDLSTVYAPLTTFLFLYTAAGQRISFYEVLEKKVLGVWRQFSLMLCFISEIRSKTVYFRRRPLEHLLFYGEIDAERPKKSIEDFQRYRSVIRLHFLRIPRTCSPCIREQSSRIQNDSWAHRLKKVLNHKGVRRGVLAPRAFCEVSGFPCRFLWDSLCKGKRSE
jgi:hypothetical protein